MLSWHCHPQVTRLYGEGATNWPGSIPFRPIPLPSASSRCLSRGGVIVRGTPYASDSHLPSASATLSLFRNAFSCMTSYATCSWPASLLTCLPLMTCWHDTYAVPYTYLLISDLSLIIILSDIRPHLQVDPYPFLFGSPARYVCD